MRALLVVGLFASSLQARHEGFLAHADRWLKFFHTSYFVGQGQTNDKIPLTISYRIVDKMRAFALTIDHLGQRRIFSVTTRDGTRINSIDLYNGEEKIGSGHCQSRSRTSTECHLRFTLGNSRVHLEKVITSNYSHEVSGVIPERVMLSGMVTTLETTIVWRQAIILIDIDATYRCFSLPSVCQADYDAGNLFSVKYLRGIGAVYPPDVGSHSNHSRFFYSKASDGTDVLVIVYHGLHNGRVPNPNHHFFAFTTVTKIDGKLAVYDPTTKLQTGQGACHAARTHCHLHFTSNEKTTLTLEWHSFAEKFHLEGDVRGATVFDFNVALAPR